MFLDFLFSGSKTPPACKAFTEYDPVKDYKRTMSDRAALETATPDKKGALYADMASNFLKSAVHHHAEGNMASTKLVIEGSELGRNAIDASGKAQGYDGIDDLLKLSAQNGGDAQHLNKMNACVDELKNPDRRAK
ncbi:MAG: hypothetical protein IPP97_08440 [Candidatus Obscuribacter sp.]|jgi:hypothetical protein|nr:hypothetical protein [Candidatus Obscuribacter sp.]MBP6351524.1 hypothetical protein [Candidatus Obscuribacter sp.]MBP6594223.1 hypothetical protein [Candidatus Obscuribacter sp.]